MRPQKLKLGLFLDSFEVPAWQYDSLERIINSGSAEFVMIVINDAGREVASSLRFKEFLSDGHFVYKILNKIDEKIFLRGNNALQPKDLHKILSDVPSVAVKPLHEGAFVGFKLEDVKKVREYGLDIIIQMGFQRLRGDMLHAAKYGVWFYEHSDNRTLRGGPPGFWEVVERRPETGATLSIAKDDSIAGWTIYRSNCLTHWVSPSRNRNTCYWHSAAFLSRQIDLLQRRGERSFFFETARFNGNLDFYDRAQYDIPSNLEAIGIYASLFARFLFGIYQRMTQQIKWCLFYSASGDSSLSFDDFKKIEPPRDRFWADPHVIRKDGIINIFVEEFLYKNHKGHISVIEMDSQGNYKPPVPVLVTDYHLSYPFVFEYDHTYYMVPESAENNSIDLYECVSFPGTWKFKMSLMQNVKAVDTTLFFNEGKWWLFTGRAENDHAFPEVELFLYYADNLFTTEWVSHPLNPVVSGVNCARPAGKLFVRDGKVYRPSQDCSKYYGYGLNINEVECLNETEYSEKQVGAVKPDWDPKLKGTHTFTDAEDFIIVDGFYKTSKLL